MANPYDPNVPLYEGQQLQPQIVQQPQQSPQSVGLHVISGIGELVMAAGYLFGGGRGDEAEEQEQQPQRHGVRPRLFGARSGRVGKGACCKRSAR